MAGDVVIDLPEGGTWRLKRGPSGKIIAEDRSNNHPDVHIDQRGKISSRTKGQLQPATPRTE